jgi:hypothetical protein
VGPGGGIHLAYGHRNEGMGRQIASLVRSIIV